MVSGECKTRKEMFKYSSRGGYQISYSSVLENLLKLRFKAKERVKKLHLTVKQKFERYKRAMGHIIWIVGDWERVIFSVETKINLWNSDGIRHYWMRDGQESQLFHLQPTFKQGDLSMLRRVAAALKAKGGQEKYLLTQA
ncbi:hypothetical protein BGZ80_011388 [Entomortierella chlamydospora]|uniref:Uncharacterized protein n=1 Tax=Entomortierella chlamydospora TaxID=101097 RepID=A0A9P6MTG5_9FUNG|nr:hypothetical protein BGZ80_011388 [Entomortierella chlamydospora]